MNEYLVLVDIYDKTIGNGEKIQVHKSGLLHRAFSVFIISNKKILLQKRNKNKYHSGGLWANACCSHPRMDETLDDAIYRRLKEELGISASVTKMFDFIYRTVYDNGIIEYEYDHVYLSEYSGILNPSKQEIEEIKWVDIKELAADLVNNPKDYASWFLIAAPRVIKLLEEKTNI